MVIIPITILTISDVCSDQPIMGIIIFSETRYMITLIQRKRMIKKYTELLADKNSGKLTKYTKKERLEFDRTIEKLELKVGGLTNLNRLPDAIFIWDIKNEKTATVEANKKNIPIIAICDSNVNPESINNPIPANDDATRTIKLILGLVGEAIEEGKKRRRKNKGL